MKKNVVLSKIPFIITLFVIITAIVTSCGSIFTDKEMVESRQDKLNIFCLDVGQGDSTYIVLPNGENMLIDAGESDCDILDKLKDFNIKHIDYVVITHPHSDHAGGMEDVLNTYSVGKLYMPDAVNSAKFFIRLLDVIEEKNISVEQAVSGVVIKDSDNIKIEILSPGSEGYDDLNNMSAVVKITYGDNKFLFMGDAEKEAEEDISSDIACDFIKVGHHGSGTSSSYKFLKRVNPRYAVISVGEFNSYGHPHDEVLERYESINTEIYRTDKSGMISVTSDGKEITIKTQK